jgi:hypothetical protein
VGWHEIRLCRRSRGTKGPSRIYHRIRVRYGFFSSTPCPSFMSPLRWGGTERTLIYTGRPLRVRAVPYVQDWNHNRQKEIKELTSKGIIPAVWDSETNNVEIDRSYLMGVVSALINVSSSNSLAKRLSLIVILSSRMSNPPSRSSMK